jgi:hypothetical protein
MSNSASSVEDSEPCFPVLEPSSVEGVYGVQFRGLTKREYIATMALQGILAHAHDDVSYEGAARDAVVYTDALLKELAK